MVTRFSTVPANNADGYDIAHIYDAAAEAMPYETPMRELAAQFPPLYERQMRMVSCDRDNQQRRDKIVIWWFSFLCKVFHNVMAASSDDYVDIAARAMKKHRHGVKCIEHTDNTLHAIAENIRQICFW